MGSAMTTIDTLRQFFADRGPKAAALSDDESLLESGLLDSMAIVKLVGFIEDRFGVQLGDDEFDPDHFETLQTIAAMIESKKS
jgi:acyl carrier protein